MYIYAVYGGYDIHIYIYFFLNLLFTDIQFTQTVIVITPTFMIKLTVMGS